MSNYAAVTVVDGTTSIGLADAPAYLLDYRFSDGISLGNYVVTFTSTGVADAVVVYVSPDATNNDPGTFAVLNTHTSAASFTNSIGGPWSAVKFVKRGDQNAKVVVLMAGYNKRNNQ